MANTTGHIFLSCGEASGDRYGADLVSALRALAPDLRISALGGKGLREAGVEIIHSADGLGVMGFTDVLRALPAIRSARKDVSGFLEQEQVDLVVPLDFPGFNGWVAGRAKSLGLPVFWLIAPQLWAWGGWRAGKLVKRIDRLGTILPFETDYFSQRGFSVFPMGHPLSDVYGSGFPLRESRQRREAAFQDRSAVLTVGLLPGSRRQELHRLLPTLKVTVQALAGHLQGRPLRLIGSVAPGMDDREVAAGFDSQVEISQARLSELLPELDLALVCSGTASLECAMAGVPHEIVYRTGRLDYALARRLVKVPYIGLANLILDEAIVREHVQEHALPLPLARSLLRWLGRPERREAYYEACDRLRGVCGPPGVWVRTAAEILAFLDSTGRRASGGPDR